MNRGMLRFFEGMLALVALLLLLVGGVTGVFQHLAVDIGDQSWVAKVFTFAVAGLMLSLPWLLDHLAAGADAGGPV